MEECTPTELTPAQEQLFYLQAYAPQMQVDGPFQTHLHS
jgi:hypothetical protein